MKSHTSVSKMTRSITGDSPQHSSVGENAVAITPPDYGINFVDNSIIDAAPVQRQDGVEPSNTTTNQTVTTAEQPNRTGLPDQLKSGIENLSGYAMDDVRVHYNSSKPAQLNALAYAQGNEIHLGSGQERHLPHEVWHVVQQRQGRVQQTTQAKGVAINDSPQLEREADLMGARAVEAGRVNTPSMSFHARNITQAPMQRFCPECDESMKQQPVQRRNDVVQRLTISNAGGVKGDCGQYRVRWVFSLDSPAPEDGYIVQQIDFHNDEKGCDQPRVNSTPLAPSLTFWEAWFVKAGKKLDQTTIDDAWTDQSSAAKRDNTSGTLAARGEVKFFSKKTTGDIGDFNKAPAKPIGGWGPGAEPQSGALPSTKTKPGWWGDAAIEGAATRWASSWWNCCGDEGSQFSRIDWNP